MKNKKIYLIIILAVILVIGLCYLFNIYINRGNIGDENNSTNGILAEDETKKLIEEKWNLALKLYNLSDEYFNWESENAENKIEDGYIYSCYPITNYNEVLEKYFTSNMYNDFENNATCLKIFDNVPYIVEGGGGFSSYDGIEEILNIQKTPEKITAIVKTRHLDIDGNTLEYRENPFTLIRKEDNWLIDEYSYEVLR